VSFWEKHKNALTTGGVVIFLLLVGYLGWIRGATAQAGDLEGQIESLKTKLKKSYPRVADPQRTDEPRLIDIERKCMLRRKEYESQLATTTEQLRFPFKKDFPWVEVPRDAKGRLSWIPGEYLITKYRDVRRNVQNYHPAGAQTTLVDGWLGFDPDSHPDKVKVADAENKLRMLALAERVTKLAIDQKVAYVLKVRPAKVTPEAAYHTVIKQGKKVRAAYKNRFIVNYPVTMEMFGSIDAIMNFFRSVHGEKQFLVIRTFKIINDRGGQLPEAVADTAKPGDLYVRIEAACMDFRKEADQKPVKTSKTPLRNPNYRIPTRPLGH
jgi:Tfp pilus assembly protein PilO